MKYEYRLPEYGGGILSVAPDGTVTAELTNIDMLNDDIDWDWPDDLYVYPSVDDWDWPDEEMDK